MAERQQTMELEYGKLAGQRAQLRQGGPGTTRAHLQGVEQEMVSLAGDLKHNAQVLAVNLRSNPGAAENLLKLQSELKALRDTLAASTTEVEERGTFKGLVDTVADAAHEKEAFAQLVAQDERVSLPLQLRISVSLVSL